MLENFVTIHPVLKDKVDYLKLGIPLDDKKYFGRFFSYG